MPAFDATLPVSPAEVFARVTSADFLSARRTDAGDRDVRAEVAPDGQGVRTLVSYSSAPNLPAFARKLVARWIAVTERNRWQPSDNGYRANYTVEIALGIAELVGTTTLTPTAGGCEVAERYDIRVKVPLFKERVRALVERETQLALQRDWGDAPRFGA